VLACGKPLILVHNKLDLAPDAQEPQQTPEVPSVAISARTGRASTP
jgi:50S ribosomal subunit-associated GTPase HflX